MNCQSGPLVTHGFHMKLGHRLSQVMQILSLLLLGGVSAACPNGAGPLPVTFVQISDVHLFDDGKPRSVGDQPDPQLWQDDTRAFDWAMQRIEKMKGLTFIVFTGDLGLEMAGPFWEREMVKYIARRLSRAPTRDILFVPGNNDLLGEEPKDIGRYRHFVSELASRTSNHVVDLSQRSVVIAGIGIHGLDSATFKNSISCRMSFDPPPPSKIAGYTVAGVAHPKVKALWCKDDDISDRLTYQEEEILRVATAINSMRGKVNVNLVFTHIPPLQDPFSNVGPPPWNLEPGTRRLWERFVKPPAGRASFDCLFAAHFHTPDRKKYGNMGLGVADCKEGEVVVAPPLAIKFQGKSGSARGFLRGTVGADRSVSYRIIWYP